MRRDNNNDDDRPLDYDVRAERGSSVMINVDRGTASALAQRIMSMLWWSSFWSAAAMIGLIVTLVFVYITINTVNVLQYDLFDLRAKTGHAHENTAPPQEDQP